MTTKRPIIGISGNVSIAENGRFPGYKSAFAYEDYITAVENAGGTPFILPVTTNEEVITRQTEHIDGLLLTGGSDINPLFYGEEPLEKLKTIFPQRDVFELTLVRAVIDAGKPVFAVCRGIQILNVAYGGTLYQDLSYNPNVSIKHKQSSGPTVESHTVDIMEGSYLYEVFGENVRTNSFHHQAIKNVAEGFKVTATTEDGVIEGIEKVGDRKVMGVQWHPERLANENKKMLQLFKDFVDRAKSS